ncbi:LysR family transcriptional regulator [uncultured Roseovarius sp.]|uniref:LysR family transcriptional regulator n=1 Tax=uncultured Roseovarius sp. TaxID=293344 RepID=UPI0026028862|nr:LysR family transcriptional regulator [uncultured Roseovarius sp.]
MKNYRNNLPPLDYLLFFEAVARHGNFTRAAEELNVSQAAVSKRVKSLEMRLGIDLVARNGRAVTLTGNGRKLAASASEALDFLGNSLAQIRQTTHERLSLAANVAISQFWLTPRVNEYLIGRNAVPITLTASDRDSDLFGPDNDVIIYYSTDIPKGWDGAVLFKEVWLPVMAPDLMTQDADIAGFTLLDFEKLTPKWINWRDFIDLNADAAFASAERVTLGSYGSALDAALRGKGIALGCPDVLHYEIGAGRLVPLPEYQINTGRSYFVVWKPGHMTQRIRDLLKEIEIIF